MVSIIDSNGNNLTLVPVTCPESAALNLIGMAYLQIPTGSGGSGYTVVITFNSTCYGNATFAEYTLQSHHVFYLGSAIVVTGTGDTASTGPFPFLPFTGQGLAVGGFWATAGGVPGTGFTTEAHISACVYTDSIDNTTSPINPSLVGGSSESWMAIGAQFIAAPALPSAAFLDTFQAPNGTGVIARTSDSGAGYSAVPDQTSAAMVIESNSPYSITEGSNSWMQAGVTLGLNDPIQATLVLTGTGTSATEIMALAGRIQSNGYLLFVQFQTDTNKLSLDVNNSGGVSNLASFTPASVFPAGTYTLTWCPSGMAHNVYFQNNTGEYYSPVSNAFQVAKIPILSGMDDTVVLPGFPGLISSSASTLSNTYVCSQVQGGTSQVMLPTDIGCRRISDRHAELYFQSSQGGVAPITYELQQQLASDGWVTIAPNATPAQTYVARELAASSSYSWRVITTDALGNTRTSNVVSGTTVGALSVTPLTLIAPGSPYTAMNNGQALNDTSGNPIPWCLPQIYADYLYRQYFLITMNPTTYEFLLYVSDDMMNWTYVGDTGLGGGSPYLFGHPTDGNYYISYLHEYDGLDHVYFARSTTGPAGPYSAYSGPMLPTNIGLTNGPSDNGLMIDFDGTMWACMSNIGTNDTEQQYKSDLTGYETATGPGWGDYEGHAPWRADRYILCHFSRETDWDWNANLCQVEGAHLQAGIAWPNASMYTTPATEIAAPAGAADPPCYSDGYGGVNGEGPNNGYGGGTHPGVDPIASYSTQANQMVTTFNGQQIAVLMRWQNQADTTGVPVLLPITYGSSEANGGLPLMPFVSSFVPNAQSMVITTAGGAALLMGA